MLERWVQSLGWEDSLEKEMETHSSILTQRIPWTEEPGGLQSMGSQRVRHNLAAKQQKQNTSDLMWEKKDLSVKKEAYGSENKVKRGSYLRLLWGEDRKRTAVGISVLLSRNVAWRQQDLRERLYDHME